MILTTNVIVTLVKPPMQTLKAHFRLLRAERSHCPRGACHVSSFISARFPGTLEDQNSNAFFPLNTPPDLVFQVVYLFLSIRIVFVTDGDKGIGSGPRGLKSLRIICAP